MVRQCSNLSLGLQKNKKISNKYTILINKGALNIISALLLSFKGYTGNVKDNFFKKNRIQGAMNYTSSDRFLSDGELVVRPDGIISDLNLRTEIILKLPRSSIVGGHINNFITFDEYLTDTSEVIKGDITFYEEDLKKNPNSVPRVRSGEIKINKKFKSAKFGVLPVKIAEDLENPLQAVIVFVVTAEEIEYDAKIKPLIQVVDWAVDHLKTNTIAFIFLLLSALTSLVIWRGESIGLDLSPEAKKKEIENIKILPPHETEKEDPETIKKFLE